MFELRSVAQAGDGNCPNCGLALTERWTVLLVEECQAVEQLGHALVRSLRRLCGLPGNLEVHPDELVSNLVSEVPWSAHIDTEPGLVAAEIQRLTREVSHETAPPDAFADELRALAARLMGLATVFDANQEATDPTHSGAGGAARDAAGKLEAAAVAIDRGEGNATNVREALANAATAT